MLWRNWATRGLRRKVATLPTARKAYQDFFELWKNADATVPFVAEARQEYDKLK